jgi:hypothetical protein
MYQVMVISDQIYQEGRKTSMDMSDLSKVQREAIKTALAEQLDEHEGGDQLPQTMMIENVSIEAGMISMELTSIDGKLADVQMDQDYHITQLTLVEDEE